MLNPTKTSMTVCFWNFFLLIKQIRGEKSRACFCLWYSLGSEWVWETDFERCLEQTLIGVATERDHLCCGIFSLLFPGPCFKSQLNIHIISLARNVVVWSCNHKRKCFPWDQWDDSTQMYVHSYYPKNPVWGSERECADKEREALSCCGEFGLDWVKHVLKYHPSFWVFWASSLTWLNWSRGDELVFIQNFPRPGGVV